MTALADALRAAVQSRGVLLDRLHGEDTTCYRLLHGVVEGVPGVAVDRYGPLLLVQTWRTPLAPGEVEALAGVVEAEAGMALAPVWNHRARGVGGDFATWSPGDVRESEGTEFAVRYDVRARHRGRDPLLFLDFRAARRRVLAEAAGRTVLNLFAYTCGAGVCAAVGGAARVLNVDFASSALRVGRENAMRNGVTTSFETLLGDCLPVMRQLAGLPVGGRRGRRLPPYPRVAKQAFDLVVLDPPRWATSAFGAVDLVGDYPSVFKPAWLAVADGGALLAANNVASVDRDAWLGVLTRAAAKAGRPVADVDVIEPEDDFPSPDGRPPLKLAWLRA